MRSMQNFKRIAEILEEANKAAVAELLLDYGVDFTDEDWIAFTSYRGAYIKEYENEYE